MQIAGNAKSQSAINQTRADAVSKQTALDQQAAAAAQRNINQSTAGQAAQDMNTGQQQRENIWAGLQKATVPTASALPATATGTIGARTNTAAARSTGGANTWNALNETAAAKMGSYGDWQTQQAVRNSNTQSELGVLNNFAGGDARILPTELEVASQAGGKLTGWGGIVSSLGSMAGMASAAGAFKGSGTPPAASTSGVAGGVDKVQPRGTLDGSMYA